MQNWFRMRAETGCESMNGRMGWRWRADETVKEEEVRDRMEVDGERKERRPLGPPRAVSVCRLRWGKLLTG